MNLEKLMAHISIIPDYRQPWKVEHNLALDYGVIKEEFTWLDI